MFPWCGVDFNAEDVEMLSMIISTHKNEWKPLKFWTHYKPFQRRIVGKPQVENDLSVIEMARFYQSMSQNM